MCIIYHFFNCMYTTKIESCDAKVYKVAKECIEYCFPDPDIQYNTAECLLNCFEKHIRTIYYPGKRYEKKKRELRCHLKIYLIDVHTHEQKFLHAKHVHQFINFFNIVFHFYISILGCNKRLIINYLFLSHINM